MTEHEIEFFDRISETWDTDERLSTPEKIKEILSLCRIEKGMKILDLGTGTGVLIPYILEAVGAEGKVDAIDISEGMLDKAKKKYGKLENVRFEKLDFEKNPVKGRYDVIFLYCVYPHLHSPRETLRRLVDDNLKEGGTVVIAFPTDESFINSIHKEKKAESDMLPSAPVLASRINEWGMNAEVKAYDGGKYVVEISRR